MQSVDPPELEDFAEFCAELRLEDGSALELLGFQRTMLRDYFAGTTETLILVPKKNGKSTLLSALALYHLVVTPDAECVIAAASRDQAAIMLRQAHGFIRRSVPLQRLMTVNKREILSTSDSGRIRILASDVETADGVIPTLAIVDELHRHRSADLYGVFRDGLGPRRGRMLTISTAGDDTESALGLMRAAAYRLPTFERDGAHRYARSGNGKYVLHEWALEPDDDRSDLDVVKAANPAPWHTVEALRERYVSASMTPWQWARYACGVWLQGEDTAIGPVEWAACGTDETPPEGLSWRVGVDLGVKEDTTAIVPHALDDEGVAWCGVPVVLVPPAARGVGLTTREILEAIKGVVAGYGAQTVVIDEERGGDLLGSVLEEECPDLDVALHSQKPAPMAEAAERFYTAVRDGKLRHPRDDVFTRHVLNAHRRSTGDGRWSFVKESKQSKKVIDALIAVAMAHNDAVDNARAAPPLIEVFG